VPEAAAAPPGRANRESSGSRLPRVDLVRSLFVILIVFLTAGLPALAAAQAMGGVSRGYGGWALVMPYVRVGWRRMGVNFNLDTPVVVRGAAALRQSPIELRIKESKLLIGEIGIDVHSGARLYLFGRAAGDARHHGKAVTWIVPANASFLSPTTWGSPDLEWWRIEGGGGVTFWGSWTLLAGMRWDHLQLRLENPEEGDPAAVYNADFRAKVRVPYLGLRIVGSRARASLLYSPWAWTDFKLPFRLTPGRTVLGNPAGEESKYSLSSGGYFLEGTLQYDLRMNGRIIFGVWADGSLMRFSGRGDYRLLRREQGSAPSVLGSVSGESSYSRHTLTLGLSAKYPF
jgi:hypothetical protein